MGGFDDHVALMGDWTHSTPLLEAFFPSMINDGESIYVDQIDQNQANVELDGASSSSHVAEPKMGHRGGFRERMAARGGFNPLRLNTENIIKPSSAADLSKDPEENRSLYLTIPPGLSPTSLLDSPVFLSNSLVLPSPTTGKFPFAPNGNNQNSTLLTDDSDKGKENTFQDVNASSFAFKPVAESSPFPYFYAVNKVNPPSFAPQSFISNGTNISDTYHLHQSIEPSNIHFQNNAELIQHKTYTNNANNLSSEQMYNAFGVQELSPALNEPEKDDGDRRSSEDHNLGGGPAEDGFNWTKYGQKPVKGSDYPRIYYKCTHPNCPVKKKVERSIEGHITEIIYKGAHNHPKPPPNHRSPLNSSNPLEETQFDYEQSKTSANGDLSWSSMQENIDENGSSTLRDQSAVKYESLDRSSTLSNDEDDDRVTHGSVSLGCDGEGEESESKRRRIEPYGSDMVGSSRAIREPRVVVQTTSDVDILDDGYRWRKYGQKVVKGNPNPRSYYKCTSPNCNVRKHVERASHDLKSVITTYEGKHNHDVPAARNSSSSHIYSGGGSNAIHFHRPQPSNNSMGPFERHQLGSLPNRPQLGSGPVFRYGMNQSGLTGMGIAGLGHQSVGHQARTMNDVAFMGPKMEPVSDSGLNPSNASTVYKQQLMSRLPSLGPQM